MNKPVQIPAFGKTMSLRKWSKETGIPYSTLYCRHERGLPVEEILKKGSHKKSGADVPTEVWIERMKATPAWKGREVFRIGDMANSIGCEGETIGRICRLLYQDGLIERHEGENNTVHWKAPVPCILKVRWDRKSLGSVLGVA